jgi:thioredoxin reductase (NADPH)
VQAARLGAEILTAQDAVKVRVEEPNRYLLLADGTELSCKALIVATGVTVRRLDAPGVDRLTGAGVYYGAALTEAANYRGQEVYVVGGANSAGQGAMFFSRYAAKVTMLETSVPGIFAAGDVRQGATRRVAAAVGEGANVVSQVHQYLRSF